MGWRERLREAVRQSGRPQRAIAADAGVAPETLSRVILGHMPRVGFEIVARIAYAAGVSIGWVLEEEGFDLSGTQIEQMEEAIAVLQAAIGRAETSELLRLRAFLNGGTLTIPRPADRADAEDEYIWRCMMRHIRREEFRQRLASLRPLLQVFHNGRLELAGGGESRMLYVCKPHGKRFYIGGAYTEAAQAIAEAVNLILDLSTPETCDDGTDAGPPGTDATG